MAFSTSFFGAASFTNIIPFHLLKAGFFLLLTFLIGVFLLWLGRRFAREGRPVLWVRLCDIIGVLNLLSIAFSLLYFIPSLIASYSSIRAIPIFFSCINDPRFFPLLFFLVAVFNLLELGTGIFLLVLGRDFIRRKEKLGFILLCFFCGSLLVLFGLRDLYAFALIFIPFH